MPLAGTPQLHVIVMWSDCHCDITHSALYCTATVTIQCKLRLTTEWNGVAGMDSASWRQQAPHYNFCIFLSTYVEMSFSVRLCVRTYLLSMYLSVKQISILSRCISISISNSISLQFVAAVFVGLVLSSSLYCNSEPVRSAFESLQVDWISSLRIALIRIALHQHLISSFHFNWSCVSLTVPVTITCTCQSHSDCQVCERMYECVCVCVCQMHSIWLHCIALQATSD